MVPYVLAERSWLARACQDVVSYRMKTCDKGAVIRYRSRQPHSTALQRLQQALASRGFLKLAPHGRTPQFSRHRYRCASCLGRVSGAMTSRFPAAIAPTSQHPRFGAGQTSTDVSHSGAPWRAIRRALASDVSDKLRAKFLATKLGCRAGLAPCTRASTGCDGIPMASSFWEHLLGRQSSSPFPKGIKRLPPRPSVIASFNHYCPSLHHALPIQSDLHIPPKPK
jgi:hypothetical protein